MSPKSLDGVTMRPREAAPTPEPVLCAVILARIAGQPPCDVCKLRVVGINGCCGFGELYCRLRILTFQRPFNDLLTRGAEVRWISVDWARLHGDEGVERRRDFPGAGSGIPAL